MHTDSRPPTAAIGADIGKEELGALPCTAVRYVLLQEGNRALSVYALDDRGVVWPLLEIAVLLFCLASGAMQERWWGPVEFPAAEARGTVMQTHRLTVAVFSLVDS